MLPGQGITWTELGPTTARATLTDRETTVSVDVQFAEHGGIERISTMRYRDVNGSLVLTPWIGYFRDYTCTQGMMIPMAADVQWSLPEGAFSVWRGHIVTAEYQLTL
ncbi:MAG: hypothetical protein M3Y27_01615 [Acidobacteriota bacterium]|nr:hypothetical protein [Acidobacteriota bacterium]